MRARRFILAAAVALGVGGAFLPTPASAGGGSWLSPQRSAYLPAEVAVIEGSFWDANEVAISDGPYIAYLLPADRWIDGFRVPAAAIPVGELAISQTGLDTFRARVEFRVPAIPSELYHLNFCNDPCTVRWIGDLVGSERFAVGATRTEGRLLLQAERLLLEVQEAAYNARQKAAGQIRNLKRDLEAAAIRETIAEVRVREVTEALRTTRRALEDERSTVATTFIIAGGGLMIAVALLVVLVVTTKRLRAARLDTELQVMTRLPSSVDR